VRSCALFADAGVSAQMSQRHLPVVAACLYTRMVGRAGAATGFSGRKSSSSLLLAQARRWCRNHASQACESYAQAPARPASGRGRGAACLRQQSAGAAESARPAPALLAAPALLLRQSLQPRLQPVMPWWRPGAHRCCPPPTPPLARAGACQPGAGAWCCEGRAWLGASCAPLSTADTPLQCVTMSHGGCQMFCRIYPLQVRRKKRISSTSMPSGSRWCRTRRRHARASVRRLLAACARVVMPGKRRAMFWREERSRPPHMRRYAEVDEATAAEAAGFQQSKIFNARACNRASEMCTLPGARRRVRAAAQRVCFSSLPPAPVGGSAVPCYASFYVLPLLVCRYMVEGASTCQKAHECAAPESCPRDCPWHREGGRFHAERW